MNKIENIIIKLQIKYPFTSIVMLRMKDFGA